MRFIWVLLLCALSVRGQGLITTFAGTDWLFPGDGKPAIDAPLGLIYSVAADARGNLYLADSSNHMVFRRTPDGVLEIVAGNGIQGLSGDDGPARRAALNAPFAVAVDTNGNVYISDYGNHRIRRVTADGVISTFAGADGQLQNPTSIATDTAGNVYFSDWGNNRIRVINAADGRMRTIAGNGTRGFSGDGGPATEASIDAGAGLIVDARGRVIFSETQRLRVIDNGTIRTIAGDGRGNGITSGAIATETSLEFATGLAFDGSGNLLFADQARIWRLADNRITPFAGNGEYEVSGDGLGAALASFHSPYGLARDGQGNLFLSDERCACVRVIDTQNIVRRIAGNGQFGIVPDGTPGLRTFVHLPRGMAFDSRGNLLVANTELSMLSSFAPDGQHRRLAGGSAGCCDEGIPAVRAPLDYPAGVAVDRAGNIYVSETGSDLIRIIDTSGVISVFAGRPFNRGFGGDNGPRRQAIFRDPHGLAFDAQGRLYIADRSNRRVRRIDTSGIVTTVAGNGAPGFTGDNGPATQAAMLSPVAVAFLPNGTLLIADIEGHRIRAVDTQGVIRTFAGTGRRESTGDGGPAASASLHAPSGLAVDSRGVVYVLEQDGSRIRRIDASGIITTIAGTGNFGFRGDGGPSLNADLNEPFLGIAVDAAGNVFFSDTGNRRIRVIRSGAVQLTSSRTSLSFTVRAGQVSPSVPVSLSSAPPSVQLSVRGTQPWLQISPPAPLTPSPVEVSVDASGLAPGAYTAAIEIRSVAPTLTIPVTLTVQPALAPQLSIPTESLALTADLGQTAEATLVIANSGGGELPFTVDTAGGDWLTVSSAQGTATADVRVSASSVTLTPGTYSGEVRVQSEHGSRTIPVTFSVREGRAPRILLSQTGLSFTAVASGGAPTPQTIGILNEGGGTLGWRAAVQPLTGGDWIRVDQSEGLLAQPLEDVSLLAIEVDPARLGPGVHYARLEVTSDDAANSPQYATIVVQVLPPNTPLPPEVQPSGLIFASRGGSNPGAQTVTVNNLQTRAVQYASARLTLDGASWFSHTPVNAAVSAGSPTQVIVQPDSRNLTPGVRRGLLTLLFDDGSSRSVNILHVVADPSLTSVQKAGTRALGTCPTNVLRVEITNLRNNFVVPIGQPATIEARAIDECGNFLTPQNAQSAKMVASFTNGDPDVNLVHTGSGRWTGTWKPVKSASGTIILSVYAFGTAGGRLALSAALLQGSVVAGERIPLLQPGSLRHSATLETGLPVAPGQLITVLGTGLADGEGSVPDPPLPSELNRTEVLLGGRPLPLLFTSDGQINAQVPYGLPANTQHQLLVRRGDTISVPEAFVVAPAQPGIFTTNAQGTGQGFVYGPDGATLADPASPVERGAEASLLATGLGEVDPPLTAGVGGPDPAPSVLASLELTVGGQPAVIRGAELMPSRTGVYRVRFAVPAEVAAGNAVEVVLTAAGRAARPVTMAIR
ncbi:MAG: hypothetical protein JNK87_03460 [Bryobacterales bacterium]|nr:hypothetical protein [Bryobacterales bacterium]